MDEEKSETAMNASEDAQTCGCHADEERGACRGEGGHPGDRDGHAGRGCRDSLVHKTGRLGMLMHRYYAVTAHANGRVGDPSRGQGRVLALLKAKPRTTQRELSYLLDMRPQSLSELLGKLEEKGLVSREKSDQDARVTIVTLTDAGAAAAPDLDAEVGEGCPLSCLTDEERATFETCVDKVTAELERRLVELGVDPNERPRHPRGRGEGQDGGFGGRGRGERFGDEEERGFGRGGRGGRGCGDFDREWDRGFRGDGRDFDERRFGRDRGGFDAEPEWRGRGDEGRGYGFGRQRRGGRGFGPADRYDRD